MTPAQGRILDLIKGSVATATLFLAFLFLPVLGLVPGLFTPLPGIFYTLKNGRGTGLAIVLAACALLVAVAEPAAPAMYLLQSGIMTLALSEFLIRLKGGARSVVYAVAVNLAVILVAALAYGMVTGANLHGKVVKGVQASIAQTAQLYQKAGLSGDELKNVQESMRQAGELIVTIYPALATVALGMMACLNLMVLAQVAARARQPVYLGDFKKYKNPEPLVWLLIASGFAMLVPNQQAYLAALNVLIVVGTCYLVQGLAVMAHFFKRYKVPPFVRLFFALLLILQPFLTLVVAVLGIFDLWGDFRTQKPQANL